MAIVQIKDLRDPACTSGDLLLIGPQVLKYQHHVQPSTGPTHDYTNCENCQKTIEAITGELLRRFNGHDDQKPFPECCKWHESLLKVKGFDRAKYNDVPRMTAEKIIYTRQHIINNIRKPEWYEEITDYIMYCVDSFGSMPADCGSPLYLDTYYGYIGQQIKDAGDQYPKDRAKKILDFLECMRQSGDIDESLRVITDTYQKWLNLFPFELNNMFGKDFQILRNQLPLLARTPRLCRYGDDIIYTEIHTKSTLIEHLSTLTHVLLGKINSHKLVKQGIISDIDKQTFDTAGVKLRVRNELNLRDYSQAEKQYGNTILQWLEDQRQYFDTIRPLLNKRKQKDYIGIAEALTKYVRGASDDDLQTIAEHKMLPIGSTAKEWIGSEADAHRFCYRYGLKNSDFKKCFGREIKAGNKKGLEMELNGSIWDIISQYPK